MGFGGLQEKKKNRDRPKVAAGNFVFVNVSPLALRIVAEGVRYNSGDPRRHGTRTGYTQIDDSEFAVVWRKRNDG